MARLFPSVVSNVVLVLVAVPPEDNQGNEVHTDFTAKVQRLVDKINTVHPSLVRYFPRRMDFSERTALFSVADVLVNSAVGNFTQ
jgi:trehalose-6-phosphate synthase